MWSIDDIYGSVLYKKLQEVSWIGTHRTSDNIRFNDTAIANRGPLERHATMYFLHYIRVVLEHGEQNAIGSVQC